MNLKSKASFLILLLFSVSIFAQNSYPLTGTVTSGVDGMPIPGANVIIAGSTTGTTTDFDGNYSINVTSGDVLQFTYVGFSTQLVTINNQQTLNVVLSEDINELNEIVVLGYGTQKKSHVTGAISKVKADELVNIAVPRVDDALVGQVSGVNIQATEGEAGSAPTIRIRGVGSINSNAGPAIVVDNVLVDPDFLSALDVNDIESFEVLKDAASAAIFGSFGANGVIIVTTKKGKEGKTKFSYSGYTGFKEARQSEDYYFSVAETAAAELAATGSLSDRTRVKQLLGVDEDWQEIIFDGGVINSHSFSARGGSKKTKFSMALGYTHDEGVLLTDDFKKYNLRLRADTKLNDKLSVGVSLTPSYTTRRRFDGSTHDILRQTPWLPLYVTEDILPFVNRLRDGGKYANTQVGDYAIQRMFDDYDLTSMMPVESGGTDISNTSNTNPGAKVLERDRNDYRFKLFGSVNAKYDITSDLNFRTAIAGTYQNTRRDRWQGVQSNRNGASAAQLDISDQNAIRITFDNYFTYDKVFGKHEITAVVGTSANRREIDFESVRGAGYDSDLIQTISAASILTGGESYSLEDTFLSFFGRVNYAFGDKYLASVSYRRDGASFFGKDSKFGDFPAVSVGWNIANEDFLQDNDFISNLKFRVSYGFTGNREIDTDNMTKML